MPSASAGRAPLVILHLSDLHFGPHCRFAGLDQDGLTTLARRLAGSVAQAREAHGFEPVALVIATGDIAESGNKKQYQDAGAFFTALADALGLAPTRLLFVPGNHDISWAHCRRVEADQEIDGFDDHELARRLHDDKLAPYRDFQAAFYGCPPHALTGATALAAGHAFVHTYDDLGISVAALDSCERETHRAHGGQLGTAQAQALMDHWHADARAHLRIVAVHHNPVADAPANIAAWAEGLKQSRPGDEEHASLIDHFMADATGFDGRARLMRVTRDCQVSLVLHGHVHTAGIAMWPGGNGFDHTLVAATGSWGLADHKRPADQPMSVQLLRLGPARTAGASSGRLGAIRLRYDPRARQPGHVEPGDFVIDSGEGAIHDLPLSLPSRHPGFCASGSGGTRSGADARVPGLDSASAGASGPGAGIGGNPGADASAGQPDVSGPGAQGPGIRAVLTQNELDQLVEQLEACAAVKDPHVRAQIVARLPGGIHARIPHAPMLRAHVTGIVDTCAGFPGGLLLLRHAVHHFEGSTFAMQHLDALLLRLGVLASEQP